ncbi:MAG: Asp-tRNA(Asn)/Glu-tRNA(Gln) amidotransferase GatCAB subunit B [Legionella sp.]|nr:MAG: Asp-tRNA(Asn)/Glu-tRNA(Gln) amidotransferase GatCAB subunit B [Legionella sp.]
MTWETVIGLEVHAQLHTNTKLFSNAPTRFGSAPNSQANIIDAGFPGTLPVFNKKALDLAIQFGLAVQATINQLSYFERKNYVYPDLPKGYQISQFRRPIVSDGHIMIPNAGGQMMRVDIVRAHLEEDAGKSMHVAQHTAVDLNRAGIPLLEIVTSPCLSSATEVVAYLKTLNQLLRFLHLCDGNMQEGSFRCDVNLSLKRIGAKELGTRVELKNLNSYRFIEKAIAFEQHRQAHLLENNQAVLQETRLYNETNQTTVSMRDKENVCDYRYFPDPDLLPIFIDDNMRERLSSSLPELPESIRIRLSKDGISGDDLEYVLSSPALVQYYDASKQHSQAPAKLIINWLKGPLAAELKDRHQTFETITVSAKTFADLLRHLADKKIPDKLGKDILKQLFQTEQTVTDLIAASGYQPQAIFDKEKLQEELLTQFSEQVAQYRSGDQKILSFLIGQAMKLTKGQADPKEIHAFLLQILG